MPLDDHQIRNIIKGQMGKTAGSKEGVSAGNLVDLMVFFLGWSAYRSLKGDDDPHYKDSLNLLRRYQPLLRNGLLEHFGSIMDAPGFTTFAPRFRLSTKSTRGIDQAEIQVEFIQSVMPRLRAKPDILRQTFMGRAKAPAMRLAAVSGEDAAESILANLATVQSASRIRITKQWLKEAVRLADVEPSDLESTIADTADARNLGEDLALIETKLDALDPSSREAVELQSQRNTVLADIEDLAGQSMNPEAVIAAAANVVVSKPRDFSTESGRAQGLSEDQEAAMMIRGKGVIAAGAGSGKTRVLASKVVYHIKELGVPPSSIMATSFSRKSAAELRSRIEKYGASFSDREATGLGTTHSIAAKLMRTYGKGRAGREGMKDYEQTSLVRLAMEQVQMGALGAFGPPPEPSSLFGDLRAPQEKAEQAQQDAGLTFQQAMEQAYRNSGRLNRFLQGFIGGFFDRSSKWYGMNQRKTKNLTDPSGLTDRQKPILNEIFQKAGVPFDLYNYTPPRTAAELDALAMKVASEREAQRSLVAKKRDKDKGLREKYEFFSKPARQWFNIGVELVEEDSLGNKVPLPVGQFKSAITKWKGRLVSPSEAWEQTDGDPTAAVYAAYEWLKGPQGESDFRGKGDFDDVLIDVSKMMLASPRARKQIQARFKVVLVDEAQDLNRSQHMMFGLITGYLDPAKASKVGNVEKMSELAQDGGKMTADTYCFIGDDKQAIYEFRSADPEAFIDMSDLVEGGAGFKTQLLETNYRSGRQIVEAANQLISHNSKQIPMVCNANPTRPDEGAVNIRRFPDNGQAQAAEYVAEKIVEEMDAGLVDSYDSYGLALRTNAEAYEYGMELLKRGIPFRSKVNFFRDRNTKAMIYWLTLANEGMNGNESKINEAVLNARNAPTSMMGKAFTDRLPEMATGNYLQWLESPYNRRQIYGRGKWADYLDAYVENLLKIARIKENPDFADANSEVILTEILQLQGFDGSSVREAMIDSVYNDEEKMSELRANSEGGQVSEEEVAEMALAPIDPLKGLLGSRQNLDEAMKYVDQLKRANEKLAAYDDPDNAKAKEPAITLGTMHSWKGLEVPHIIIPMVGGKFPRDDSTEEDLASERRLAYVAITRGENQVTVLDIPTTRVTKTGIIRRQSRFPGEMCVPVTQEGGVEASKMAKAASAAGFGFQIVGWDYHDPDVMDAYLRGDLDLESIPAPGPLPVGLEPDGFYSEEV